MRATVRSITFDPDPRTLPDDSEQFALSVRLLVGPSDGPGEESFDLVVCSGQWLAERARREGYVDARHHVVVDPDDFDERRLRQWLESRVSSVHGDTWGAVAGRIADLGHWEFADY